MPIIFGSCFCGLLARARTKPATSPACVPPLEVVNTIASATKFSKLHCAIISSKATAYPIAPTAVLPPIGIE